MLIELKSKLSEIMHKDKFPLFAVVAFSINFHSLQWLHSLFSYVLH